MAFCSNCGKELLAEEKFCSNCGTSVDEVVVDEVVVEEVSVENVQENKVPKCFTIFAKLGYIFGLVSFILAFIPFLGAISIELGPVGIVFSILGKKDKTMTAKCKKGLVFSILGTVIGLILYIFYIIVFEFFA